MATFNFCPNSLVPETLPRDPPTLITFNGWHFAGKPTTPYQRKFRVKLFGLTWFVDPTTGAYDSTTQPTINARAMELFYQQHETWLPFDWVHPHLGAMTVRFAAPVIIPPAPPNAGGLLEPVEITLVHHNPGYV